MAREHAINEIRKLQAADLEREVHIRKMVLAKHAIGVSMGNEKDTSRLKKERKGIARMLTIMNEQKRSAPAQLKNEAKASTVSAPVKAKKAKGTVSKSAK